MSLKKLLAWRGLKQVWKQTVHDPDIKAELQAAADHLLAGGELLLSKLNRFRDSDLYRTLVKGALFQLLDHLLNGGSVVLVKPGADMGALKSSSQVSQVLGPYKRD